MQQVKKLYEEGVGLRQKEHFGEAINSFRRAADLAAEALTNWVNQTKADAQAWYADREVEAIVRRYVWEKDALARRADHEKARAVAKRARRIKAQALARRINRATDRVSTAWAERRRISADGARTWRANADRARVWRTNADRARTCRANADRANFGAELKRLRASSLASIDLIQEIVGFANVDLMNP